MVRFDSKVKHIEQTKSLETVNSSSQPALTLKSLPQELVMLMGRVKRTTGGLTVWSRVPLHAAVPNTRLRMSRDSLYPV